MIREPELRPAWRGRGAWRGWRCSIDTDAIAAALTVRERAVMATWRDRS